MKFWLLKSAGTLEDEEKILEDSVVTIGWAELPDLSERNKEQVKKLILEKYPSMREELSETWAEEICSFITKIENGDLVAVPLKTRNEVLIGKISGNYEYRWLTNFISHIRKIMWLKKISKEELEEEYDVDFNSSETLYPIKADLQKLSTLVGTKSLESLIGELSFVIEDLDLMKERMLELVHRLAETEEISEVREIAEEMEKILKEK
jgi:predicted Mrr-cat superfamily restriction endonuclease